MGRKFYYGPVLPATQAMTTRLGAQNTLWTTTEIGKLVKFATASESYVMCAQGDLIHGRIESVETASSDGYTIGSVNRQDGFLALADGSQAAGTGSLAVGDAVVCGVVVAVATALTNYPKVAKATLQPGAVPADLTAAGVADLALPFWWKVMSLRGDTGAVGKVVYVEKVFCNK